MKYLTDKYIQQIGDDISYSSDDLIDVSVDKLEKGWEKWDIGQRIGWLYQEDFNFYKEDFAEDIKASNGGKGFIYNDGNEPSRFSFWIKRHGLPYQGILFTFPDKFE